MMIILLSVSEYKFHSDVIFIFRVLQGIFTLQSRFIALGPCQIFQAAYS